jgi:hypothetical protein
MTLRTLTSLFLAAFAAAATLAASPLPVDLGTAANFSILSKSGISTVGTTSVTGNMGTSPNSASSITGFGLIADSSNQFSTSSLVNGKVYAADYSPPTPASLTTSIGDMEAAYVDAAGRAPGATELGAGIIGGLSFAPGVYKWSSGVLIASDIFLVGSSKDTWIFQIAQTLDLSSGIKVVLSGGALAANITWQVGGQATLDTGSTFNGDILGHTAIVINTGATMNGKALAQTAVTLQSATVISTSRGAAKGKAFAYPSPARGDMVSVAYFMSEAGRAEIRIHNEAGELAALVQEDKISGSQRSQISIKDFAPGIYLVKVVLTYNSGTVESLDVQKFGRVK